MILPAVTSHGLEGVVAPDVSALVLEIHRPVALHLVLLVHGLARVRVEPAEVVLWADPLSDVERHLARANFANGV